MIVGDQDPNRALFDGVSAIRARARAREPQVSIRSPANLLSERPHLCGRMHSCLAQPDTVSFTGGPDEQGPEVEFVP
jgi:hypothetical protein